MKNAKNLIAPSKPSSAEFSTLMNSSLDGLKRYTVIMTALDAGLFECTITPKTFQTVAEELGAYHPLMIQMLCETLVELNLLVKQGETYVNAPLTVAYLCEKSPYYMKNSLQNMKMNANRWAQLPVIIKKGPIIQQRQNIFNQTWLGGIAEWAEAGSVANTLNVIAKKIDTQHWKRLLDLGGGHGLYAIGFTALNPYLEAYIFDLPRVAPLTNEYIKQYSANRAHFIPGDFTKDDIGEGYDVIFSSFNQSCNDPEMIPKIIQALAPSGDLILRRFKDSSREGAMQTLDWNLQGFEGRKIGSKPHSSDRVVDRATYLKRLVESGLNVLETVSVDEISEITFARKL
ncbi:MAG: methyltransferase [Candidatus Bathyarchaeia archaeon]